MKPSYSKLLATLLAVEQAYSNRHSPQHRAACLAEARAVIAQAGEQEPICTCGSDCVPGPFHGAGCPSAMQPHTENCSEGKP